MTATQTWEITLIAFGQPPIHRVWGSWRGKPSLMVMGTTRSRFRVWGEGAMQHEYDDDAKKAY
jgi:hypothetical protein